MPRSSRPLSRRLRARARHAYTLAEILVALTVSGFVTSAGLWLLLEGVKSSARTTNATVNDLTQWGIASRLWIDSRVANGISIYTDDTSNSLERWLRKQVDQRGNFIVFSLSTVNGSNQTVYSKLSGYVYDADEDKIFRFDYPVPAADQASAKPLEAILTDRRAAIMATYQAVASDITLANNDGLFICRAVGTAASLSCVVTSSTGNDASLAKEKTIEATFYVRS
ncbi:hypothetical protein [Actomonas aquatica]|uniref:Prepilin-type N-terminal cleavage/methylation domain-containing protein n=1 Tax=Actomonas aquatica TaxID=2866162 RepID=A0ABZ1C9A2_9BACT|nr:hypothetical protein [Opitutus sp. WL0086]WRQ88174.1 hypothetical protein K1X11_002060 [Opitutus sp. WL0086]